MRGRCRKACLGPIKLLILVLNFSARSYVSFSSMPLIEEQMVPCVPSYWDLTGLPKATPSALSLFGEPCTKSMQINRSSDIPLFSFKEPVDCLERQEGKGGDQGNRKFYIRAGERENHNHFGSCTCLETALHTNPALPEPLQQWCSEETRTKKKQHQIWAGNHKKTLFGFLVHLSAWLLYYETGWTHIILIDGGGGGIPCLLPTAEGGHLDFPPPLAISTFRGSISWKMS